MALEAGAFQQPDPLNYCCNDRPLLQNPDDFIFNANNWTSQSAYLEQEINPPVVVMAPVRRPRRRRIRSLKSKEEVQNQRMTHIAVERNRRKQMNHYLNILRSIMPPSCSQRGDQASIIEGAINYVKELEQLLQTLEAQKQQSAADTPTNLFTFPQYSACSNSHHESPIIKARKPLINVADVEVTMAENHANIKILSERQSQSLMKIVGGLYSHGLTILHLNVTPVDNNVLYCLSAKVEGNCKVNSVNEIAAVVHELVGGVREGQEEADR